jgi:hypothetical protein
MIPPAGWMFFLQIIMLSWSVLNGTKCILSAVLSIVPISTICMSSAVLSIVPEAPEFPRSVSAVLSIRPTVPRLISSVLNIWLSTKVYPFLFIPPLNNLERPKSRHDQRKVVAVKTQKPERTTVIYRWK